MIARIPHQSFAHSSQMPACALRSARSAALTAHRAVIHSRRLHFVYPGRSYLPLRGRTVQRPVPTLGLRSPSSFLSLRGAKQSGALSAKREEVLLGCNPPKPSPGEKVAERKRGRKWNAGRNVGRGESIDFLKCRSGISLSIYRTLGDHPHSTSVICSFFANASFSPGEAMAASRTDYPEASPSAEGGTSFSRGDAVSE